MSARRILVASDGSPESLGALRVARALSEAAPDGAHVDVVVAVEPLPVFDTGFMVSLPESELIASRSDAMRDRIAEVLDDLGGSARAWDVHVETGQAAPTIARVAAHTGADLLVTGLGHHRAVDRIFGTETVLQLLHLVHLPVLAVPPDADGVPARPVFALDFSTFGDRAARAAALVVPPGTDVHLAHVLSGAEHVPDSGGSWQEQYEAVVRKRLGAYAAELELDPERIRTHLREGNPAEELLSLVDELDAGVLVAGSHGHSFIGRLLLGSVSTRLVRKATRPLLVVPPPDPDRQSSADDGDQAQNAPASPAGLHRSSRHGAPGSPDAPLSLRRAEEILEAATRVRVLVVGDLMLDRYISGFVERISPEAPVPVVRVEEESFAVGGAGNVAANVVTLGARCDVVGLLGEDEGGRLLREALERDGVRTDGLVSLAERPTTMKTRIMARRQQIVRVDREHDGDVAPDISDTLVDAVAEMARACDVVALEDYNKGVLVPRVITAALGTDGSHHLPTVVDPKRLRFFDYRGCTVFKPNAKELADALGERLHPDDPQWMEETRRRLGCENLLLTLGEAGVALGTAGGRHVRSPAVARAVYDVSGAGDTVTAVTAVCLGAGASVVEAAVLANHAAAVEVGKAGVATVSPEEIIEHIHSERGSS